MISSTSCQKAQEFFISEEYEKALEYVERCITSTIRQNQKSIHSKSSQYYEAKFLEARIYTNMDDYEKASEIFSQIRSSLIGNDTETFHLRGKLYYFQSQLEYNSGNIDDCIELMLQAKENFIKADYVKSAIDLLFDIQDFTIVKNDDDRRLSLLREIVDLSSQLRDKNDRRLYESKARLMQGKILKFTDTKLAENCLKSAEKNFDKMDKSLLKVETLLERSMLEERNNLSNAEKLLINALETLNDIGEDQFRGRINLNLGRIKLYMGKDEEALEFIQDGIKHSKDLEVNQEIVNSYLSLAKTAYVHSLSDEQMKLTTDTINQTLSNCDQLDDRFGKNMCHILDGLSYYKMGDKDSGDSKLQLIKILIPKLHGDADKNENAQWINKILSLIVEYSKEEVDDKIKIPKNPHPLYAEQNYIAGMYLLEAENNSNGKVLLKASRDAFDKLSSRKNSYKKIVENLEDKFLT